MSAGISNYQIASTPTMNIRIPNDQTTPTPTMCAGIYNDHSAVSPTMSAGTPYDHGIPNLTNFPIPLWMLEYSMIIGRASTATMSTGTPYDHSTLTLNPIMSAGIHIDSTEMVTEKALMPIENVYSAINGGASKLNLPILTVQHKCHPLIYLQTSKSFYYI